MTETERMNAGLLYDCSKKEIMGTQTQYVQHMQEYNTLGLGHEKRMEELLKIMFAEVGEGTYIQPPFYANWGGHNVHLGKFVFANFGTTFVDDGNIYIASEDIEACRAARKTIENIVFEPEIGALYYGRVSNIRSDFGAWVELAPGKDGLVKIKDLEFKRTEKVEDVLNIGDMTWVKVMNVGPKGIDLSRKDALKERGEA